MATEADCTNDREATLELNDGSIRVPVYYAVRSVSGISRGYLRVAYGYGSFVNRLLRSVGVSGWLVTASGIRHHVQIISTDPGEAPGYLCAVAFPSGPGSHVASPDDEE